MPRFYFNIHDGKDVIDDEGYELADLNAARKTAILLATDCLRDSIDTEWSDANWRMEVADAAGRVLYSINFGAKEGAGPT